MACECTTLRSWCSFLILQISVFWSFSHLRIVPVSNSQLLVFYVCLFLFTYASCRFLQVLYSYDISIVDYIHAGGLEICYMTLIHSRCNWDLIPGPHKFSLLWQISWPAHSHDEMEGNMYIWTSLQKIFWIFLFMCRHFRQIIHISTFFLWKRRPLH